MRPKASSPARQTAPPRAAPPRHQTPPGLTRERRQFRDDEPEVADYDRVTAAARTGREELKQQFLQHNAASPELTGGDIDANWNDAYSVGDEAPGGDNPTPDQDRVDDIGKALGVNYQDDEELRSTDKISDRDRHRWELDPASSDDWPHEEND